MYIHVYMGAGGHAGDEKTMVYHAARWEEEQVVRDRYKWPKKRKSGM